jgi:hypothetical protein
MIVSHAALALLSALLRLSQKETASSRSTLTNAFHAEAARMFAL